MPTRTPEFQATVTCNRAVFARLWCQPIRGAHCTERATPHPARHDRGRRFFNCRGCGGRGQEEARRCCPRASILSVGGLWSVTRQQEL